MIRFPEYKHSLLSLSCSVLKHYGADSRHDTLPELDKELEGKPRNVIVMLFDGMSCRQLERHLPRFSFLRRHIASEISSVYPPTTVAATTTIESGLSPIEHGHLGWWLYFEEAGDNVTAFANLRQSDGKPAADRNLANSLMPFENIFTKIESASPDVQAEYVSPFGEHRHRTLLGTIIKVIKLARRPGRSFIYCYRTNPDHFTHGLGISSPVVRLTIRYINFLTSVMRLFLKDTVLAITADHGLVDVDYIYLEDYPGLMDMLVRPPSIESRAASIFVKEGMQDRFELEFKQQLGEHFILFSKKQVYARKLFGDGVPNPRADGFIGDFIAASTGRFCLAWKRGGHVLKAAHAGLTEAEMMVPIILWKNTGRATGSCN